MDWVRCLAGRADDIDSHHHAYDRPDVPIASRHCPAEKGGAAVLTVRSPPNRDDLAQGCQRSSKRRLHHAKVTHGEQSTSGRALFWQTPDASIQRANRLWKRCAIRAPVGITPARAAPHCCPSGRVAELEVPTSASPGNGGCSSAGTCFRDLYRDV